MMAGFAKATLAAVLGVILFGSQGCSNKWLQSDGEQGGSTAQAPSADTDPNLAQSATPAPELRDGNSGLGVTENANPNWKGQGVNPELPGIAESTPQNELTGFSQDPSEERLTHGSEIVPASSANRESRHHAELTKEQEAATEAGLSDVFFGFDQWTLSEAGMEALNQDAKWLKENPGSVIKVEGHCDERGTAAYNMVLGDKRSKSARSYLVDLGVNPKRVTTVSYGKERPFCSEPSEACYQQNRRGHLLLKKVGSK
ncbi:OmpA family protein [Petrachloros mirabilis]